MTERKLKTKNKKIKVMIIGSGFGGAVTALRLAEKGIKSVMLERGKHWPLTDDEDTFSSLENPDGRSAWLSTVAILGPPKPIDKYIGVLELIIANGIAVLAGAGVGGGSLIYAAALVQPNQDLFERAFGNTVDYKEMDSEYYPRVRSVIKLESIPEKILKEPDYLSSVTWKDMADRTGLDSSFAKLGLSWEVVEKELEGERVASVIKGDFWYGNNSGAKNSLDRNYLKKAQKSGKLKIKTQHNVTAIMEGHNGSFLVEADEIDTDGTVLKQHQYEVKKLFLAAGSMGTSKLLVRSKATNNLPKLNDEIGKNWGNNGDFFSSIKGLDPKIKANMGGTVPVIIRDYDNSILPTAVECYADWSSKGITGLIASVGLSTPPAKGYFSYDSMTDVVLTWPSGDNDIKKVIEAGKETYEKIADACGIDKENIHPIKPGHCEVNPVTANVTAHPLGGAVLDSATDNIGTVKNYKGLYVIDGALVPGHTGCTNPALTIAALAERNIEKIIKRDFDDHEDEDDDDGE